MLGLRNKQTFADGNITAQRLRTTCSSSRKICSPSSRTRKSPSLALLRRVFINIWLIIFYISISEFPGMFFLLIVRAKRRLIYQHQRSGKKPSPQFFSSKSQISHQVRPAYIPSKYKNGILQNFIYSLSEGQLSRQFFFSSRFPRYLRCKKLETLIKE